MVFLDSEQSFVVTNQKDWDLRLVSPFVATYAGAFEGLLEGAI